jgi:hypothetical protein
MLTLQNVGYAQGEIGTDYSWQNKRYQIVQLDSASTAPTTPGSLAFWQNRDQYIVTGTVANAIGGAAGAQNQIAGRFGSAITPGYRCHIQQRGPAAFPTAAVFAAGMNVVSSAAGALTPVAVGTAASTQSIGLAQGPASGGNVTVYMDIQPIE